VSVCQEVRMRRSAVFQSDIDPDVQQINALNQLQPSAKSAQSFTLHSLHALFAVRVQECNAFAQATNT
jgi:hypothetical protein